MGLLQDRQQGPSTGGEEAPPGGNSCKGSLRINNNTSHSNLFGRLVCADHGSEDFTGVTPAGLTTVCIAGAETGAGRG